MKSPISSASKTLFSSVRVPYSLSVLVGKTCLLLARREGESLRLRKLQRLLDRLSAEEGTAVSSWLSWLTQDFSGEPIGGGAGSE